MMIGLVANDQKFLAIENKTFDIVSEGKQAEDLRLCENGRGFRVSILFWEDKVDWLFDAF